MMDRDNEGPIISSLSFKGDEAGEIGAARRKKRLQASISGMKASSEELARIERLAVDAGLTDDGEQKPAELLPPRAPTRTLTGQAAFSKAATSRAKPARVSRVLARVAGGDDAILNLVPDERITFVKMAVMLVVTACAATLSMFLAIHDLGKASVPVSALNSLLWGAAVLQIYRFIVVKMGGDSRDRIRPFMVFLLRALTAAVVSLTVAAPVTVIVFSSEISEHISAMDGQPDAASSPKKPDATLNATNSFQVNVTSPQLTDIQKQVDTLKSKEQNAARALAKAAQACSARDSCKKYFRPTAQGLQASARNRKYHDAVLTYQSLKSRLKAARMASRRIRDSLTATQRAADAAQHNYAAQLSLTNEPKVIVIPRAPDSGILMQLKVLVSLSSDSYGARVALVAVLLPFLIIGSLPMAAKTLGFYSAPGHERLALARDTIIRSKETALWNRFDDLAVQRAAKVVADVLASDTNAPNDPRGEHQWSRAERPSSRDRTDSVANSAGFNEPEGTRVSAPADWLTGLAVRLVPARDRCWYAEECRREQRALAAAGSGGWQQLRSAAGQVTRSVRSRTASRTP